MRPHPPAMLCSQAGRGSSVDGVALAGTGGGIPLSSATAAGAHRV